MKIFTILILSIAVSIIFPSLCPADQYFPGQDTTITGNRQHAGSDNMNGSGTDAGPWLGLSGGISTAGGRFFDRTGYVIQVDIRTKHFLSIPLEYQSFAILESQRINRYDVLGVGLKARAYVSTSDVFVQAGAYYNGFAGNTYWASGLELGEIESVRPMIQIRSFTFSSGYPVFILIGLSLPL